MGFVRFIADLPWWVGLAVFLGANFLIPMGTFGLAFGLFFCLLGMWIFSKLMIPDSDPTNSPAIIGLPLFVIFMVIFSGSDQWTWVTKDYSILYGLRIGVGMLLGLIGFTGFKK